MVTSCNLLSSAPVLAELGPLCMWIHHMNILVTDLCRIYYTTSPTTDLIRIRDIILVHTDLTEICHRADSTADLSDFCRKSYDPPDPLIPVLPS